MPRSERGLARHPGKRASCKQKRGTGNAKQDAAARVRAAAAAAEPTVDDSTDSEPETDDEETEKADVVRSPRKEELQRSAFVYHFRQLGEPPRKKWGKKGGTLAKIRDACGLHKQYDTRQIEQVLDNYLAGEKLRTHGGGRKPKLTRGEAKVVASCLETGAGQEMSAAIASDWRRQKGIEKPDVSRKAARTAITMLDGQRSKRLTTTTATTDKGSKWATSRFEQAKQWQAQVVVPPETAPPTRSFKVESSRGRARQVESLEHDPLCVISGAPEIGVVGSWWGNVRGKDRSKAWPCKVVGYVDAYKYMTENGSWYETAPAYIIHELSEDLYYPMRTSDVSKLLPPSLRPTADPAKRKIPLQALGFADQKHKRCNNIGSYASPHQYRFPKNARGEFTSVADGGALPPKEQRKKSKFEGDGGRMCFAIMMKRGADGTFEGHKAEPFNYSGSYICGIETYEERVRLEIARVANFDDAANWASVGGKGIDKASKTHPGGRYSIRYPTTWKEELKKACAKKIARKGELKLEGYVCITDMLDHLVAEFNRLFKGTPFAKSWVLMHDALDTFWMQSTQKYLLDKHKIGPDRLMCIKGSTNPLVDDRYRNKLVGDSPEFMPLDSNCFSYYETAMSANLAHTYLLKHDHPDKHLASTPDQVQRLMFYTWKHDSPTSEDIVRDIYRYAKALGLVVDAEGAKVPRLDTRQGRRRSVKGEVRQPTPVPAVVKLRQELFKKLDPPPKRRRNG